MVKTAGFCKIVIYENARFKIVLTFMSIDEYTRAMYTFDYIYILCYT